MFPLRIYILTIAANEGWKVAADVSFSKKGNTDKDLVKALKKKEKRKKDGKDEPKAKSKKTYSSKSSYKPRGQQNWGMNSMFNAMAMAMGQLPAMPSYGGGNYQRSKYLQYFSRGKFMNLKDELFTDETRQCMICRQVGHLARNCPQRGPVPAALGAPPK